MHLRQLVLLRLHLLLGGKRLPYCVRSTADPIHPLRRQQFGQDHSHVPKAAAQVMISTLAPAPTAPAPAPPAPVRLAGVSRCMHHANTGPISFSPLMHRVPLHNPQPRSLFTPKAETPLANDAARPVGWEQAGRHRTDERTGGEAVKGRARKVHVCGTDGSRTNRAAQTLVLPSLSFSPSLS